MFFFTCPQPSKNPSNLGIRITVRGICSLVEQNFFLAFTRKGEKMLNASKKKKLKRVYEYFYRKEKKTIERKKKCWQRMKQIKSEAAQPTPEVLEKKKYYKETPIEELAEAHDKHFRRRVKERLHEGKFTNDDGVELLKQLIENSIMTGEAKFLEEHQGVLKYQVPIGGRCYIVVYSLRTERYVTIYPPYGFKEMAA